MEGRKAAVATLLARGANVHHVDFIGFTALKWADEEKHKECAKALREAGATEEGVTV